VQSQKESEVAGNRRKKTKTDLFRKFLEPNFVMFESEDWQLSMDEYGASIADLPLKDLQSQDVKWSAATATAACVLSVQFSTCLMYTEYLWYG